MYAVTNLCTSKPYYSALLCDILVAVAAIALVCLSYGHQAGLQNVLSSTHKIVILSGVAAILCADVISFLWRKNTVPSSPESVSPPPRPPLLTPAEGQPFKLVAEGDLTAEDLKQIKEKLDLLKDRVRGESYYFNPSAVTLLEKMRKKLGYSYEQLFATVDIPHSKEWQDIHAILIKLHRQVKYFLNQGKRISWVTGTRSPALIGIDEVAGTAAFKGHALVPTGILLQHKIVPLTGELGQGMMTTGVNQHSLSGVNVGHFSGAVGYATQAAWVFSPQDEVAIIKKFDPNRDRLQRLKIAVLRLLKMGPLGVDQGALQKRLAELLNSYPRCSKQYQKILSKLDKGFPLRRQGFAEGTLLEIGSAVGVRRSDGQVQWGAILRTHLEGSYDCLVEDGVVRLPLARLYKPREEDFDTVPFRYKQLTAMQKAFMFEVDGRQHLKYILSLYLPNRGISLRLGDEERDLLKHSFPVVWGASPEPERCVGGKSDVKGEVIVRGSIFLRDVAVAFTNKKSSLRLQRWLERRQLGCHVMSLWAGHYLSLVHAE